MITSSQSYKKSPFPFIVGLPTWIRVLCLFAVVLIPFSGFYFLSLFSQNGLGIRSYWLALIFAIVFVAYIGLSPALIFTFSSSFFVVNQTEITSYTTHGLFKVKFPVGNILTYKDFGSKSLYRFQLLVNLPSKDSTSKVVLSQLPVIRFYSNINKLEAFLNVLGIKEISEWQEIDSSDFEK